MRWHRIALLLAVAVVGSAQTPRYATEVLPGTVHVQNPDFALGKPDDKYAGIEYYGILDLAISLTNGEGNDLAVYAKRPRVGILPETMTYAVFVKSGDGDWVFVGVGGGETRPENFDLGDLRSADKIRIVFKDPRDVEMTKPLKPYPRDYLMGIDAVEALH
jgi:hypothetical protein